MHRPVPPASLLAGTWWDLPDLGRLTVAVPTASAVAHLDREWPEHRPAHHANLHWSWGKILKSQPERLAIVDAKGVVLALWSSAKHRPLRLPEGSFYRLDYLERDPRVSAGLLGAFAFALAGARALELGCDGLVLASLPEVATFYDEMGGERRIPVGWRPTRSLVPFIFSAGTLTILKEDADGFKVEDE